MQRAGTSLSLQDIEISIRQVQSAEELLAMLTSLLDVAETSVGASPIEVGKLKRMAEYLAEIRSLLDTLGSVSAKAGVSFAAKVLCMRYRDLEGRVKEMRNDRLAGGPLS